MLRILLNVSALTVLFGGAVVYGGNAIGAWDPLPPAPTPPPAVDIDHAKAKKKGKHSSGSPVARRLSAAEKRWVRKADALCRVSVSESNALTAKAYGLTRPAEVAALFAQVRALNKRMNDEFLALHAPASYRPALKRLGALFQKEEHLFDAMYQALARNDTQTYYSLSDRVTAVALDESEIAADLGAYDCDVNLLPSFG